VLFRSQNRLKTSTDVVRCERSVLGRPSDQILVDIDAGFAYKLALG